jgi:hypothetical protein
MGADACAVEQIGTGERILFASAELFRRQGYAATGLKQVTGQARAPFGSLYHFLPGGKQQLAEEVLRTGGAKPPPTSSSPGSTRSATTSSRPASTRSRRGPLSLSVLAILEGAFLLCRALRDTEPMDAAGATAVTLVTTALEDR